MRYIVRSKLPSKGPDALILPMAFREDALTAAGLSKAGKVNRAVLRRLAQGSPVTFHDAIQACFAAMACAVTAKGQSMGRRRDREAIERVWGEMMRLLDIATPPDESDGQEIDYPGLGVNFADREDVEQWLAE